MAGKFFGIVFAVLAICCWDDTRLRTEMIILGNIWAAASYARGRA